MNRSIAAPDNDTSRHSRRTFDQAEPEGSSQWVHHKENFMRTPFAVTALFACVLWLGACDKTPTAPATPMADKTAVPAEAGARAGSAADPSLPSAESALPPVIANKANPPVVATDGTRSPAQESKGLPLPGQNNDHSAPIGPAKRASAP
jgi:hypothetical protein